MHTPSGHTLLCCFFLIVIGLLNLQPDHGSRLAHPPFALSQNSCVHIYSPVTWLKFARCSSGNSPVLHYGRVRTHPGFLFCSHSESLWKPVTQLPAHSPSCLFCLHWIPLILSLLSCLLALTNNLSLSECSSWKCFLHRYSLVCRDMFVVSSNTQHMEPGY